MNAFLRKTVKGLRFIGIAVLVTTGLSNLTVLAAEGDVDSLLVIPAASSEGGAATENLGRHIEFALGEALMEIGILPLAGDFLTMPNGRRNDMAPMAASIFWPVSARLRNSGPAGCLSLKSIF